MNGKRNGKRFNRIVHYFSSFIEKIGRPFVRRLSDLAEESLKNPGSWKCLEIVYKNQPRTLLDTFFLNSRSARATRNRLRILQGELYVYVLNRNPHSNPVRIINLGSGPGHEVLECLNRFKGKKVVTAICIDKDPGALAYGKYLAKNKGLNGFVEYRQCNVLRLKPSERKYHIAIISGLIDYFDHRTAKSVLQKAREKLRPEGILFVANMRRHYLASTMSILGNWKLVYREPEELEELLMESGFCETGVWLEPEGIFCIGKGRVLRCN